MKKRVLLRVAYDGTNYHGWQVQPGAVTIEQVLNEKLTEKLNFIMVKFTLEISLVSYFVCL